MGSINKDMISEIEKEEETKKHVALMCGYLPGATDSKSPLTSPLPVRLPETDVSGDCWEDVCGGGCGFAMAISESGKLITWGSADDQGQSYLTSGKHGEIPEPFPLPVETPIRKAAAGWAHIGIVTEKGEVFTWGWKECVPSQVKVTRILVPEEPEEDVSVKLNSASIEEVSPDLQGTNSALDPLSLTDGKSSGEETIKRRKTSSASRDLDSPSPVDETLSVPPCIVALDPGVKITSVAAGGRHTLVLSDVGQVWGWGYGGEGQLGLGSRIKTVNSPHLIPCIEQCSNGKDRPNDFQQGSSTSTSQSAKFLGSCIKTIACGGRHSAVITDAGVLLTFGWGSYGQCGHGNTNDVLSPSYVSSLLGEQIKTVAAGLWHTLCITTDGRVHAFGGNQFGQLGLGTGPDESETSAKLVEAPLFDDKNAITVSCGARHSTILTEDGSLFSWGWNKYGQLGLGDTIDRNIPSRVTVSEYLLRNVACGWWHTLLLAEPI